MAITSRLIRTFTSDPADADPSGAPSTVTGAFRGLPNGKFFHESDQATAIMCDYEVWYYDWGASHWVFTGISGAGKTEASVVNVEWLNDLDTDRSDVDYFIKLTRNVQGGTLGAGEALRLWWYDLQGVH